MGAVKITLRRLFFGSRYLEFDPPQTCACGGVLQVQDHRTPGERATAQPEGRYECFCQGCKDCDPNGHSSQAKVIAESPAYFNPPSE